MEHEISSQGIPIVIRDYAGNPIKISWQYCRCGSVRRVQDSVAADWHPAACDWPTPEEIKRREEGCYREERV